MPKYIKAIQNCLLSVVAPTSEDCKSNHYGKKFIKNNTYLLIKHKMNHIQWIGNYKTM